jgi:hypothetical protein
LIVSIAAMVLFGSARSIWMWFSSPPGQGQRGSKGLARAGQHPPALGAKAFHRGMADSARGAGQDKVFCSDIMVSFCGQA